MWASPPRVLTVLSTYDFGGQSEQSVREQWIYPLLGLLGYGIGTSNPVDIPLKVDLANPIRAIGSHRFEVDYRPTVHGVGMWIIEAKKPGGAEDDLFSDLHLGQAWSYASHPEVDVPFMALANGQLIRVYDITQKNWDDEPLVDIEQADLASQFGELEAMLGARRVADFVRRRQLRHLRTALLAQLDEEALDQTIADVKLIVDEARPVVQQSRSKIRSEAFWESMEERDRIADEIGVWGIAWGCISPNVPIGADISTCVRIVKALPPNERPGALDQLTAPAIVGDTLRVTFALRILRLAVVLRLTDDEACGDYARQIADAAAQQAATELADDPTARAAHHFEMVLPAFLARLALADAGSAMRLAAEVKAQMDVETWLRRDASFGLEAGALLARQVELLFRVIWNGFAPWTADALEAVGATLRLKLAEVPLQPAGVSFGQIANEYYQSHVEHDPLKPGCRNVIVQVASPTVPTDDEGASDRREFALQLLRRYFPEAIK